MKFVILLVSVLLWAFLGLYVFLGAPRTPNAQPRKTRKTRGNLDSPPPKL